MSSLNVSVIIIGKNVSVTLQKCINSIKSAIKKCDSIENYEIIYVDSCSTDDSITIAKKATVKVIEIKETNLKTASLGRFMGVKYRCYDDVLFIDADMELSENWFNDCLYYYLTHLAVVGDRHELIISNNNITKEIVGMYNYVNFEQVDKIGGFFMVNLNGIEDNFTPCLINEEECNFYAKIYDKRKFYSLPLIGFKHFNSKPPVVSRIFNYLKPYQNIGYIVSFFHSFSNSYLDKYIITQSKYVVSFFFFLFMYIVFIGSFLMTSISTLLLIIIPLFFLKSNDRISVTLNALFFPYKIICTLLFFYRGNSSIDVKYLYEQTEKILHIPFRYKQK